MKIKLLNVTVLVVGLLVAGIVGAALLTTYVTVVGTADIEQSVAFGNGDLAKSYSFNAIAGNEFEQCYDLENRSNTTAPIAFTTTTTPDGVGVETSYWSSVELSSKDSSWDVTPDMKATLTYELISSAFNYELEATGLTASTNYSLIYYADKPDRFVEWGGNNPGALIVATTSDSNGEISVTGSASVIDLPSLNDANIGEYDYCVEDDYLLCHGAKVWLVPSTDYASPMTAWNPSTYLFETDLIAYGQTALNLGTGKLNFCAKTEFDVALTPGTYTVTTQINPQ